MSDLSSQLFDQMVNISKAHGYDIVSKEAGNLRRALQELVEQIETLDGVEFSRDLDLIEAETCWNEALSNAKKALR